MHPAQDLGSHVTGSIASASVNSGAPSLVTAAGTGDATKVTGDTVDRKVSGGSALADSLVLVTAYLAALADTKTLSFAIELQESSDDSSWDTAEVVIAATVVATGTTGGTNETGVNVQNISLRSRKRYIRFNLTPDLSATATDTALFTASAVLGGYEQLPQ